ncbi:hypothetical protein FAP39_13605 [Shimia litoralis]|uniref:Uncharacterized protein n=1 Tax=Shimia litoralis TaxID=420403 RepID=A0A4U7MYH5_9RHOB|nr:hypothetical protein [Shimia litoralis]TKZ17987.1 hypothetical protein FAP39_13605 [Shimia litoralis]
MLGVVLWSDSNDNKAVIWCEDHGDLAFFNGGTDTPLDFVDLDEGDLVRFDLSEGTQTRFAKNPRRVGQGVYAGLADRLQNTPSSSPAVQHDAVQDRAVRALCSAEIIPFATRKSDRAKRELVAV